MKAKFTAVMILSAMLLTACNPEPSLVDELETSETLTSAQDIQAVQGGINSAENEGETNYILGGETETTLSVAEETTSYETLPPKIENFSEDVELDIETIDISSILSDDRNYSRIFFLGDIAVIGTSDRKGEICFFDTNDQTLKSKITPPDGWEFDWNYHCIKGSGDILCKIQLSRFDSEKLESEYAVIIVRNDFTTEFLEGEPQEIFSFPAGNHNISNHSYDIFDADSGEVIVEGFDDAETASVA
ncbi:MAG: hypothetical protein K2K44_12135 [Oscillospiraceae bacterium]|nr:hypothetical protein [Oscillospiraceae bacterium]